ncbi:Retrotransposon gag protein [Phytophthora infestans]|uniref:Retrotransposon gag protein n=1 Tax=Phytophthora infestans TaxID=4787 RepID=A0A833WP18_PHYIN|nr:Retrotransposon gag protein [Phytophthora infestans]
MVSNLAGQAAARYVTLQREFADITALAAYLRRAFIPPDLQEHLRDSLYQLKQRECRDPAEYVTKYRQLISRVKDMDELDKITLFTRGLVSLTRVDVVYRRCSTVHQAIK